MNTLTKTPKIFLTDYASYNEGTQFEFGHWVDLEQFNDADELRDYITDHFKKADKKRPLACGTPREEIMVTDYEDLPELLYSESGMDWDKVFNYIELSKKVDFDDYEELLSYHNQKCSEEGSESYIYDFDEDFFSEHFSDKPMEAARSVSFGEVNWSDEYIKFNGYANLESIAKQSLDRHIDKDELIEWLLDNPEFI